MSSFKLPTLMDQSIAYLKRNQDEVDGLNQQITSGKRNQDLSGFAKDQNVENLINIQGKLSEFDNFSRGSNQAVNRLNTQDFVIGQIQTVASTLSSLFTQRRSVTGDSLPLTQETDKFLEQITSLLNTKEGGNYIFSGSKTDVTPITTDLKSVTNIVSGSATNNYYNGDSTLPSVRLDDATSLTYGATANDVAFQKLIGAINLARDGHAQNNDITLGKAVDMISEAVNDLVTVRAKVKTDLNLAQDRTDSLDEFKNLLTKKLSDIRDTDLVDASTRLSELQSQMQASLYSLTKITQISLVNFLS